MPNTTVNYAKEYSQALDQAFPHVLYFGALYTAPNNGRYRFLNSKTIEVPTIETTGRVDADRDTIETAKRNWSNTWTPKTLENQRKWSTLVHPQDIEQTNMIASIQNITQAFNEGEKFPEMDCYTSSKIYAEFISAGKTASVTVLTADNILSVFDKLMEDMDEAKVPKSGRILYVTTPVNTLLKNAKEIMRTVSIDTGSSTVINRNVSRIDEVLIVSVPTGFMKTEYNFTVGAVASSSAKQINLMLIHPQAIITPHTYEFAKLDEPSAMSEGKYVYFEESHEDVFILPHKIDAVKFNITA